MPVGTGSLSIMENGNLVNVGNPVKGKQIDLVDRVSLERLFIFVDEIEWAVGLSRLVSDLDRDSGVGASILEVGSVNFSLDFVLAKFNLLSWNLNFFFS